MADPTPKELMDAYEKQRCAVGELIERVSNKRRDLRWAEEELERARKQLQNLHDQVAPMIAAETARLLDTGS